MQAEGVETSVDDIKATVAYCRGDIRRVLLTLQLAHTTLPSSYWAPAVGLDRSCAVTDTTELMHLLKVRWCAVIPIYIELTITMPHRSP